MEGISLVSKLFWKFILVSSESVDKVEGKLPCKAFPGSSILMTDESLQVIPIHRQKSDVGLPPVQAQFSLPFKDICKSHNGSASENV